MFVIVYDATAFLEKYFRILLIHFFLILGEMTLITIVEKIGKLEISFLERIMMIFHLLKKIWYSDTVWKFKDFSATQISRQNNFGLFQKVKK